MLALSSLFIKTIENRVPGGGSSDEEEAVQLNAIIVIPDELDQYELGPGDKTLGFTEAFENILDESPCLRFYEDKSLKKLPQRLITKYMLDKVFEIDPSPSAQSNSPTRAQSVQPHFFIGRSKLVNSSKVQYLIITSGIDLGRLTYTKQDLFGLCYECTGAGILDFKQRKSLPFARYLVYDKYKTLLRISGRCFGIWLPCLVCSPFYNCSTNEVIRFENLDGTLSGGIKNSRSDNSTGQVECVTLNFEFGLNRKAKFMMLAAALAPCSRYFWTR